MKKKLSCLILTIVFLISSFTTLNATSVKDTAKNVHMGSSPVCGQATTQVVASPQTQNGQVTTRGATMQLVPFTWFVDSDIYCHYAGFWPWDNSYANGESMQWTESLNPAVAAYVTVYNSESCYFSVNGRVVNSSPSCSNRDWHLEADSPPYYSVRKGNSMSVLAFHRMIDIIDGSTICNTTTSGNGTF